MKKTLLLAALAGGLLLSCKKHSSGSSTSANSYHFTATIDGKAQTFNVTTLATRITTSGVTMIAIEGFNGASNSTTNAFGLTWTNTSAVSPPFGTGPWYDTSRNYSIGGVYAVSSSEVYESGTNTTGQASLSGISINNPMKITITSMDSNTVKGLFSGDFYAGGDVTKAKKTVTNGDFYVAWKK